MAWINDFLEKLLPVKERNGTDADTVVIDIPADLYYAELALYTVSSLIGNAISRSEIRTYVGGKSTKGNDYYLLNVSPNINETSSLFWHKVVNKMIRKGEAIVIEVSGHLYCVDSYTLAAERPISGNIYTNVQVGTLTMSKTFYADNIYKIRLDNIKAKQLMDGVYSQYGQLLSTAGRAFKQANAQKYKLHIDGVKAGDDEFNKEFETYIKKQLQTYLKETDAVYPEFDGYELKPDENTTKGQSASDYISLREDIFKMYATAFHIPDALFTGNVTSISDVMDMFLTFAVDPVADAITEALNMRSGVDNYISGNRYKVYTGAIKHKDIFDLCDSIYNLIGSGRSYDEIMEDMGEEPLKTEWSQQHFLSKNFVPANEVLNNTTDIGKEVNGNEE